ncbi:MAG TPA: ester cyclase [Vicinamibacterales bacterium]|nr:ester cyclase [Vicinamibacterales bacterium]
MQITAYERTWVDGLNRGDVSVADKVFAPDCVIHINGSPERNLGVDGFKQMVSGLLAAFGSGSVCIGRDPLCILA